MQVLDWCKSLLGYPVSASGLLTGGCSASNLIGLAVARNSQAEYDLRREGLITLPVAWSESGEAADLACRRLQARSMDCTTIGPG